MLSASLMIVATALVATTTASPIKRITSDYAFAVADFSYGCSPGGCAWSFNVSAPASGADAPAFGPTPCTGTDYDTDYVSCSAVPDSDTQFVSAWIQANSSTSILNLKYENSEPANGSRYDYYGSSVVQYTGYVTDPVTDYQVPVTTVTGVA